MQFLPPRRARSNRSIHVVLWLPRTFYAAVAATFIEMLELTNVVAGTRTFTFELVSRSAPAASATGISFAAKPRPSGRIDALVLLGVPGLGIDELVAEVNEEARHAARLIARAERDGAILAAHCAGTYFLAQAGVLDRKRATTSWWLKADAERRFPHVRWDASRLVVRHGRIYTCGGGFSGLELARALLVDLGYAEEERIVRKLLVLPPSRRRQTPYEIPLDTLAEHAPPSLAARLDALPPQKIASLDATTLAKALGLAPRTLARKLADELHTSPGRWIRQHRLETAKRLLETTTLTIAEICTRVGYEDVASFGRRFSRTTGLSPGEYRRQSR